MGKLVDHAKKELELLGEDQVFADDIVDMVTIFEMSGHSGYSAVFAIRVLTSLLRFENLSPLTNDPSEWEYHTQEMWPEPGGVWQNRRNGEAFSNDGGKTYYLLSEVNPPSPKLMHVTAPRNAEGE